MITLSAMQIKLLRPLSASNSFFWKISDDSKVPTGKRKKRY